MKMRINPIAFLPIGSFLVKRLEEVINSYGKAIPGKIAPSEIDEIMKMGAEKVRRMLGPQVIEDGK
jgi:hypothetical protein